LQIDVSP
jgi:hypothetical protein